jgi:hypothetical protein
VTRYRIEQALVSAFGVLVGLALAMLVAPGDFGLWVVIAILLALFCRAFFIRGLYGELLWPVSHHHHAKRPNSPLTRR